MTTFQQLCHGPGIRPDEEKCLTSEDGFHEVNAEGNTAPYNGVRHWRCPRCHEVHRSRVRALNEKSKGLRNG
jgi:transposase